MAAAAGSLPGGQWAPWLALAACAGGGQFLEAKTPLGRVTSAPLLAMVLGMCVSGLRLLPEGLPGHVDGPQLEASTDPVRDYGMIQQPRWHDPPATLRLVS